MHKHLMSAPKEEAQQTHHRVIARLHSDTGNPDPQQPAAGPGQTLKGTQTFCSSPVKQALLQGRVGSERAVAADSTGPAMEYTTNHPSTRRPDSTAAAWEAAGQLLGSYGSDGSNSSSNSGKPQSSNTGRAGQGPLRTNMAGSATLQGKVTALISNRHNRQGAVDARSSAVAATAAGRLKMAFAATTSPTAAADASGTCNMSPGSEQQQMQSVRQSKYSPEPPAAAGQGGMHNSPAASGATYRVARGPAGSSDVAPGSTSVAAAMPLPLSTSAGSTTAAVKGGGGWGQHGEYTFAAQQQHAGDAGNMSGLIGGGGGLGLAISGSVMATVGGWMFTEAVDAATAAATAAIAGPRNAEPGRGLEARNGQPGAAVEPLVVGNGGGATAAAAASEPDVRSSGGRWSFGGLLSSAKKMSKTPAKERSSAGGRQQSEGGSEPASAAAAGWAGGIGAGFWRLASLDSSGSAQGAEDAFDSDYSIATEEEEQLSGAGWIGRQQQQGQQGQLQRPGGLGVPAAGGSSSRGFLVVGRPGVAQKMRLLRGLLLWQDRSASLKALGLGVYVVLLIGNIPNALHYMQLTTLLPAGALLYLLYNLAMPWAIRAYCLLSGSSSAAALSSSLAAFEASVMDRTIRYSGMAVSEAGAWALAVLSVAHKALRAQRFTTTVWTAVSLWLLLLLSELRIVNQTLLAMLAYAGLFSVPWCYYRFKPLIDAVVYDFLHLVTLLVMHAERWAYVVAAVAAVGVWQLLATEDGQGSMVVQASGASAAALAVLGWRVMAAEA